MLCTYIYKHIYAYVCTYANIYSAIYMNGASKFIALTLKHIEPKDKNHSLAWCHN